MCFDDMYRGLGRLWGDAPSELAVLGAEYLRSEGLVSPATAILDLGCGYGRDVFYLAEQLGCPVTGVDSSPTAITMAQERAAARPDQRVTFVCQHFAELGGDPYDMVFAANLYQVLRPDERREFRHAVRQALRPGGRMLLCTPSVRDPEPYGKGVSVPDEPNSYEEQVYFHLCTEDELREDFRFLTIDRLWEHEYDEPRTDGADHHHISWILIGQSGGRSAEVRS